MFQTKCELFLLRQTYARAGMTGEWYGALYKVLDQVDIGFNPWSTRWCMWDYCTGRIQELEEVAVI